MIHFTEENSDFYDQEYYIGLEYRYLSGAFDSRVKNILKILGDIKREKGARYWMRGRIFEPRVL